jgi:hypothetical protein
VPDETVVVLWLTSFPFRKEAGSSGEMRRRLLPRLFI